MQVNAASTLHRHREEEVLRLEARAEDQNVELMMRSVFHGDAGFGDLFDAIRVQRDMVLFQRARPDAIVAQAALTGNLEVRRERLFKERITARLTLDIVLDLTTKVCGDFIRRIVIVIPCRVLLQIEQRAIGHGEEEEEPVPDLIEGYIPQQVEFLCRQCVVIVRGRSHPAGRALEDGHGANFRGNFRYELNRARACADHADLLAGQIHRVVPAG